MKLSVCIPTYNRAQHLENCLNSLISCKQNSDIPFEVCVSDNCSTDNTSEVVRLAQKRIDIKYNKNDKNEGIPRNFLNVVAMATGDFVWLIGDDDLVLPDAIYRMHQLIEQHPAVDFFYVNSFHLHTEYLDKFPSPFDTANLPRDMEPFSKWTKEGELEFLELINPKISFDFLGGMFLSVFRRSLWVANTNALDKAAIADSRTFSHFDNTFPHVKIFSRAFASSRAYFNARPMNVCLTGAREWSPMYPFVHSIRLVEALSEYRKNGLSLLDYLRCKNYALNNAIPDLINILRFKNKSGYAYVKLDKIIMNYCLYPNFYLSVLYFIGRRLKRGIDRFLCRNN